ncbi:hypothetical protein PHLGIDRAFT_28790 [Phlebiopsis gigantea 11061_1 CR5-6]|uniref:Uncharacterized protein n=1 Tax=Phlebiopsis gigantea (strain 11061_1 CR5-6) TaxID=745531 RepID=A0A0C3PRI2_PHLG1|nr:hypothetical protein PHLGIDRAFT_28790 [Phlebiopsis gigantea 11061_1 CR5-6]
MSALLEEDESEYSDITPGGSSAEPSRSPSPLPEEEPTAQPDRPSGTSGPTAVVRSRSHRSAKESSSDDGSENPDARLQAYARSQGQLKKSYSYTRRLSRSISPTPFSYSQTLPTHTIPPPTLEPGVPNKPGLTLPHAAYNGGSKAASGDGKVDLVRAGIAQTSMATVEVTRGAALQDPTPAQKKKRRTFSFQLPFRRSKGPSGKGKESLTPAHLLSTLPIPVAYLSHLPPPSYVPPSYVLVQVFAVGLDSLDSLLVQEKTVNGAKSAGFIPGRSIVGKAIEVGWEVKADVCRRGEWIIGLLDVKQSGALAEFIVIERHRIHRAPQPLSRPGTLFPSIRHSHVRTKSLPSQFNRHPFAQMHQDLLAPIAMSIEELAVLPICGVPAYRAIRTFADVISPAKPRPNNADSGRRARILVLQGHDGPGAIAVQMLSYKGVQVWVQVPDSVAREDASSGEEEDADGPGPSGTTRTKETRFDRLEARLRAWGAEAICVGDPLEVLERLAQDGRSFDAILDTIGGTDVWEAGRKVLLVDPEQDTSLAQDAAFTTLVGDTPSRPIPSAQDHLRSGFRSLKRTMSTGNRSRSNSPTKSSSNSLRSPSKDSLGPLSRRSPSTKVKTQKRSVSYAWVSVAADLDFEGGDVRDSLGALVGMVEEGLVRPWLGDERDDEEPRIVPFDKSPEIFRRDGDGPVGPLKDGGTCVVRIIP